MQKTSCLDVFAECVAAIQRGELIESASSKDKEFHFQNWFQSRLSALKINCDSPGRNTYPDFRLVEHPEGYEIKALAWPGRERDYDCNSQVPSGLHNGRTIFYVFGRYPADTSTHLEGASGQKQYPVIDLVICHGDFLNAEHSYIHKNRNVKGFGSYGDIMIRDRKMYVAPTPFALIEGSTGLHTLILPASYALDDVRFKPVGNLDRLETNDVVIGYEFDLRTNLISSKKMPNPTKNKKHSFIAYRLWSQSDKTVSMTSKSLDLLIPELSESE
jgi:hypothetical protein